MDWLENLWENLTSGGKAGVIDRIENGWPAPIAVIYEIIKDGFCILVVIGLFLFTGNYIKDCSAKHKAEFCNHDNVDESAFRFDKTGREIVGQCNDCGREFWANHYTEHIPLTEGDCLTRGTEKVIYTAVKYEGQQYEIVQETNFGPCSWLMLEERVNPTCFSEGHERRSVCTVCGKESGGQIFPIVDHKYEIQGAVEPTCTTVGQTGALACVYCFDPRGESEEIPCIPHTTTDEYTTDATYEKGSERRGYCTACNQDVCIEILSEPLLSQIFDYTIDRESGTAILLSYKGTQASVVIPASINAYPLKQIPSALFKNNSTLTSVTISEGIEAIGDSAFEGCSALREVSFATTLKQIGSRAFYGCREIRRLYIENGRIGTEAFAECLNMRIFETGYGVDFIDENAFYHCPNLLVIKFSPICNSARRQMFDSSSVGDSMDISDFVPYRIGNYSGYYDKPIHTTADTYVGFRDGFYYDNYSYPNKILSVDLPNEKHIVIPDWARSIDGRFFRGLAATQIESVLVPDYVTVYCYYDCQKSIKLYLVNPNCYDEDRCHFSGVGIDPETGEEIEYTVTLYYYEEDFENANSNYLYWHFDANGGIVEYDPKKENDEQI